MVNTREIAEEYRLKHWAKIMHERAESGLSIRACCKRNSFHPNIYYYWKRKLREAACQELLPAAAVAAARDKAEITSAPPGWAVCNVKETESKDKTLSIEIGKGRITVAADTDADLLTKVCRVLASLC